MFMNSPSESMRGRTDSPGVSVLVRIVPIRERPRPRATVGTQVALPRYVMWSDREAEHDFLGYSSYVAMLGEVCTLKDLAPLTVGIFGSWGSGKTSLMRMLKADLDGGAANTRVRTLWFNAWRYQGREEGQSALLNALLGKLGEDKGLRAKASDLFAKVLKSVGVMKLAKVMSKSALTLTPPSVEEFAECFKEESEKLAQTMDSFNKDFEALLEAMEVERVVVFIDDLDRCSSEQVIETFETIKLFLTTPACTFVVGADAARIERAVGDVYKGAVEARDQRDYLEKIIQLPFRIPEQGLKDVVCYVGMLAIAQHIGADQWGRLAEARNGFYHAKEGVEAAVSQWPGQNRAIFPSGVEGVATDLQALMPHAHSLARGLRGNPRQIKRFLNILSMRQRLARRNKLEVQDAILVKLAVVEYVWPEFFRSVVETVDPGTGTSTLLGEVMECDREGTEAEGSPLLAEVLSQHGLVEYLMLEPKLDGEIDLAPYLFLAQTSLQGAREPSILPVDQQAKSLASLIAGDDRVRSRSAARRAASLDAAAVGALVRLLLADLAAAKDAAPRANILNGLREICEKHHGHFPAAVKALEHLDEKQEGVAIAALAVIDGASRNGTPTPAELRDRFVGSSKLAAALARKPKKGK